MSDRKTALEAFDRWYGQLKVYSASGGPARGSIAAGLVVLDRLKTTFDLNLSAHRAPGGSQIQGSSGPAAQEILERFGEQRPFLSEGGRTNRGAAGDVEQMLSTIKSLGFEKLPNKTRVEILTSFQEYLVNRVREWHARKRLSFSFSASKTAWQIIYELLHEAREVGKEGQVAQYLVGAKLQMRYPDINVENFSYSTSDAQQGRHGDFQIKDTAFHVTVAPAPPVYARCLKNLNEGLRVYLIVPERLFEGARQNAELAEPGRVSVRSLESFVGGNLDEMSTFSQKEVVNQFRKLLDTYNARVDEIENDKSLMIEIPESLNR